MSAEWTGLVDSTTPRAPARTMAAATRKTTTLHQCPPRSVARRPTRPWRAGSDRALAVTATSVGGESGRRLALLGRAHAVAELARPRDPALVGGAAPSGEVARIQAEV